jgi:ABC-2 type transport system ATP-binding protein
VTGLATGAPDAQTVAFLRHASMAGYGSKVRIPTMLMQGEGDTLFNIDEAVANRNQIMANGAYVKLVLQSWGHSFSNDPTDNTDFKDPAHPTYEEQLVQRWFDHYLKDLPVDTGPPVEYFRDWLYDANGSAQPAYGSAPSWPVAPMQSLALSGTTDLVPLGAASAGLRRGSTSAVTAGTATILSVPGPGSYSETSAVQYSSGLPFSSIPATDPQGLFAAWSTAALTANVDVAGIPTLTFHAGAAAPALPGADGTAPVLFAKLYDVAPDGTASLLFPRLVAPIRIADFSKPVTVTLPGVVHRFAAGHVVKLVLASSDDAYLNSRLLNTITVTTGPDSPSLLSLPVLSSPAGLTPAPVAAPSGSTSPVTGGQPGLANTSASTAGAAPAALALLGLTAACLVRRRRRG